MVAGALAGTGYFMGNDLYAGDEGNPKGYFEDKDVNEINDVLIGQVIRFRPPGIIGARLFASRLPRMQGWLARLPVPVHISPAPRLERRMRRLTERIPFCFKDPRFCYTLPAWRPHLGDPVFVCVFRHPGATGNSIVKECLRNRRLRSFKVDFDLAVRVWVCMYEHVLEVHWPTGGDWVFVHYDQFLEGAAFHRLEARLGVKLDRTFGDSSLRHSADLEGVSAEAMAFYWKLCDLAGYRTQRGI